MLPLDEMLKFSPSHRSLSCTIPVFRVSQAEVYWHSSRRADTMTRPQVLCTCSKCRQQFCRFSGELTRGRPVTSRTRNKHVLRDQWDCALDEQQEATVSNTIMLTSTSHIISRQGSKILPVRRSDSQRTIPSHEGSEHNHETASVSVDLVFGPFIR